MKLHLRALKNDLEEVSELIWKRFSHFRIETDDQSRQDDVVEQGVGQLGGVEPHPPLARQQTGEL
jgi:hypothetical protein